MCKKIIIIVLVIIIICTGIYFAVKNDQYHSNIIYYDNKIDSLNCKIDSLKLDRDRLIQKLDSSKSNVEIIEHWYEKEYNTILTQPVDSDCMFFSKYLSSYIE